MTQPEFRFEPGSLSPPSSDDERLAWLRLARSQNVGAKSFRRLVARYGDAAKALDALPSLAARGGARAYKPCSLRQGEGELGRGFAFGARMICLGDPEYPPRLAEIADAPMFLWALGDPQTAHRQAVAIVGARNASSLGLKMARNLAEDLGDRGYAIVSGLARGIDTAAHEAALPTGTAAALAGGVDSIYPRENQALADRIAEHGLLVTEAPMGLEPQGRHFPRRNRIISGLSEGVVVIEAATRSGTLITARCALEQGREAMAAPGAPLDPRASGCNDLIRQGAALIRNADDVTEALGSPAKHAFHEAPAEFEMEGAPIGPPPSDDLSDRLTALLTTAPVHVDDLAQDLDAPPRIVAEALIELELAGRLDRRPGGMVALSPNENDPAG